MEKLLRWVLPPLLLTGCLIFIGCPDKKAAEQEQGSIEKWTEKTAEDAVDKLQGPIDEARALKEQADERLSDMTQKLNDQPTKE